ncbi:uncharacterized protein BDV14DRAFT_182063 [Aspergillus stella-maris]|uniref:uncharacterized protein n=1 Tax=Aspergillus stella-maris TaxID=1810926 RepID=UPI003CCCBAAC
MQDSRATASYYSVAAAAFSNIGQLATLQSCIRLVQRSRISPRRHKKQAQKLGGFGQLCMLGSSKVPLNHPPGVSRLPYRSLKLHQG